MLYAVDIDATDTEIDNDEVNLNKFNSLVLFDNITTNNDDCNATNNTEASLKKTGHQLVKKF